MRAERIVVVGGGLAGLRASERLRERNFDGDITIVTAEHRPYNRPSLSKQLLSGKRKANDLHLSGSDDLDARWRMGTHVVRLDAQRQMVVLPGREELPYDGVIIASGVEPRHLPGSPMHATNVAALRTLADGQRLHRSLARAQRVAIIGGGFIGCEIASTVAARARHVTIIDPGPVLMERALGTELGAALTQHHRDHGVDVRTGASVAEWIMSGHEVDALVLDDGDHIDVDVVVVAIGTMPSVAWLAGLGLDLSDGVLCSETCHVVGLPHAVAAGDLARWTNRRFTDEPRRVEHWIVAIEQARHAADSLLDGPSVAAPFRPVPRFWSEQHGMRIQAVGMAHLGDEVEITRTERGDRAVAVFRDNERIMGAIALDSPLDLIAIAERIEQQPLVLSPRRWGPPLPHPQASGLGRAA